MGRSRKSPGYLDYPLFPRRQRPWPRLLLGGAVLGLLAFIAWGRMTRPLAGPIPPPSVPERAQTVLIQPTPITPTATLSLTSTLLPSGTEIALIDDVDEVEIPWTERGGREEIITYTVQSGDTLWSIAGQFDLDVDTLRWSNPELVGNPDLLAVGTELAILPVPGVYHTVESGETLISIAARYGVAEVDILNYPLNKLERADELLAGQKLVIPHGRQELARPTPQPSLDSPLAWPLVGTITQGFSDAHRALDIGAPYGSPVYAGAAGQVTRAGWARTGYGYTVIVDHGQGLGSLYSHMKGAWVQAGDWVERGQLIGEVGSTGNSSGPHVHVEVRVEGEQVNPLEYLPAEGPR